MVAAVAVGVCSLVCVIVRLRLWLVVWPFECLCVMARLAVVGRDVCVFVRWLVCLCRLRCACLLARLRVLLVCAVARSRVCLSVCLIIAVGMCSFYRLVGCLFVWMAG